MTPRQPPSRSYAAHDERATRDHRLQPDIKQAKCHFFKGQEVIINGATFRIANMGKKGMFLEALAGTVLHEDKVVYLKAAAPAPAPLEAETTQSQPVVESPALSGPVPFIFDEQVTGGGRPAQA